MAAIAVAGLAEGCGEQLVEPMPPAGDFVAVTDSPEALTAHDFNADGHLDLAVANYASNDFAILIGHGDGTFGPPAHYSACVWPSDIIAGDFNGDGVLDLAIPCAGSGDIAVALGNESASAADGTFAEPALFPAGEGATHIAVDDFNEDGAADLAVANYAASSVTVLLGNSTATTPAALFSVGTTIGTEPGACSLAAGDIDVDQSTDLVFTSCDGGSLSVALGVGDGTFLNGPSSRPGTTPRAATLHDLTGDGALDVVVANQSDSTIAIIDGARIPTQPQGDLREGTTYAAGAEPYAIAVSNLDSEGEPEIIVANRSLAGTVTLLSPRGRWAELGTSIQAPLAIPVGELPNDVVARDFNRDGIPDLAVTNCCGVTVLLGHRDLLPALGRN